MFVFQLMADERLTRAKLDLPQSSINNRNQRHGLQSNSTASRTRPENQAVKNYSAGNKNMVQNASQGTHRAKATGLLLSGGLDSAILLKYLQLQGSPVQPLYVDCGLLWQRAELRALRRYLFEVSDSRLAPLVVLSFPLDDVYESHWSITGRKVPSASTSDQAMFLPGRNLYLVIKASLWCQSHGIEQLALAILKSNPFPDASVEFFRQYELVLQTALGHEFRILRPFAQHSKREVMEFGHDLPLELTFSCICPVDGLHCGACNKCAERQAAFREAGLDDRTVYARHATVMRLSTVSKTEQTAPVPSGRE